jgi:hypothetical protein
MERKKIVKEQNLSGNIIRPEQHLKNRKSALELRKKINRLERSLAERENEVWTLKQLLLYK